MDKPDKVHEIQREMLAFMASKGYFCTEFSSSFDTTPLVKFTIEGFSEAKTFKDPITGKDRG